jgi:hypothetical protein
MTGPHPERFLPGQLGTFSEHVKPAKLTGPALGPNSDLEAAVTALMVCANVSRSISYQAIQQQMKVHEGAPLLTIVLRAAWQDLQNTKALRKAAAANFEPLAPRGGAPATTELAESRSQFIATQLGNNSRAMTAQEIMTASKNLRRESYTGEPADIVPLNLEKYWQHHRHQIQLTPRGNLPHAAYNQRIHRQSYEALHQEACQAAKATSSKLPSTAVPPTFAQPQPITFSHMVQPCYDDNAPMYAAPDVDPGTTSWRLTTPEPGATPASASHVSAAPQHSTAVANHVAASHAAPAAPPHPQPTVPTLPIHSSPTVRLAYDREQRRSAAASQNGGSNINIVVDTGLLPANSIIWRQGAEADGAGFNYHAFAGVKASWEQANADKDKSYHTFKSFIDARFIGTVCDYIKIDRVSYDRMLDSTLLQLVEECLKPKDSTIYFMKASALRISWNERDGTLSSRYRAFADPFMALVNEARDAGTPLQKESVKSFFKTACNSNNLLRMWANAESWTTLQEVHHRIFEKLQLWEAHELQRTLSTAPAGPMQVAANAQPPAVVPAPPAPAPPPAAPPPPARHQSPYSQEQRREYQLQQQQNRLAGQQQFQQQQLQQQQLQQQLQQQQHQVMANVVQQSIDSAMQRITNSSAPSLSMQPSIPLANTAIHQQQHQQFTPQSAAPHPGLDSRGPFWHVHGPHLLCSRIPCVSSAFCQGCGMHGHSSADCRRRNLPGWNPSGYFSDRYPGIGALAYQGPPRAPLHQGPASPAAPPSYSVQQPRIAPPMPVFPQAAPFPTPHKLNLTTRSPAQSHSTAQVNASTQSAPTGAPGTA